MCWGGMCIISTVSGLSFLGADCVGCQHLLGYITLCGCWIGACGLFGILLVVSGDVETFYVWMGGSVE